MNFVVIACLMSRLDCALSANFVVGGCCCCQLSGKGSRMRLPASLLVTKRIRRSHLAAAAANHRQHQKRCLGSSGPE